MFPPGVTGLQLFPRGQKQGRIFHFASFLCTVISLNVCQYNSLYISIKKNSNQKEAMNCRIGKLLFYILFIIQCLSGGYIYYNNASQLYRPFIVFRRFQKNGCVEPELVLENLVIRIQCCNQPLSTYFIIEQKAKNQSSNYKCT